MMRSNQSGGCAAGTGPAMPGPAHVATQAEARLRSRPYRALHEVCCAYRQGVLTLRGCLPSYYLKQLAQAAVAGIEGVQRIDNQIEVASPPPEGGRPRHGARTP